MTPAVRTYDVFDTLLTRAVGRPTSLFLLMGRLPQVARLSGCSPEQWARTRTSAERLARTGRAEVTLQEVYEELGRGLALPPGDVAALLQHELDLEHRLSRVVPSAAQLLKDGEDSRRVALSDMYLPSDVVRGLLRRHGLDHLLDEVRVSSTTGATKSSGEAYLRLLRDTGATGAQVHHVGDHPGADVRVPRLLGIRATHTPSAHLNRYEQRWEDAAWSTDGFASLVAGASRSTRLQVEAAPELRPVVEVTAGVAAPVLLAYVLWVLRSAAAEGVQRLYFLARDGEVLLQIARRLDARLGLGLDLRYLHGSRSVYHRASLADGDLASASWAWKAMYGLTAAAVLQRLGLDEEESEAHAARLGLASSGPVDGAVVARIVGDEQVAGLVTRRATGLRERLQDYLRQQGLSDGTPYGVVDTGWAGRVVQALEDALPEDARPPVRGWFFGYMDRPDGARRPDVLRGYLFDDVARTGVRGRFAQAYGPIETFTVADCGMTTDFVRGDDGTLTPVLASPDNPVLADWPWELMRTTMLRFVDELVMDEDIAAVGADLRLPVAAVLEDFWDRPTAEEARAWGRYPYEDDLLASSRHRLATGLSLRDFVRKSTDRGYEGRRLWLQGSVALTGAGLRPPARAGLWAADRLRRTGAARFAVPDRALPRAHLLVQAVRARRSLPRCVGP